MTETSSDTTRNSRTFTRSRSTAFALSALILMGLLVPLPAHAACTTPAGEAGDQFFNTTVSRMQYCDGTNWVNMGVSALSDNLGNHTASQALAMGNFKITDLATPTDATDAVTKAYVDGLVGGGDNLGDHIATTVLRSETNNTDDLGTTAIRWKDGWFAGAVTAGSFSGVGTSLTDLNASNITSGTVPTARLGYGTANATTYLRGDGTWAAVASGGGSTFQQFNSSGTWTKPTTGNIAFVECWGGGGGGAANTSTSGGATAAGGGGGAYMSRWLPLTPLPNTVSVTIGIGGTAVSGSTNGGSGGTTTFGTFLTAYGGGGGGITGGGINPPIIGGGGSVFSAGITGASGTPAGLIEMMGGDGSTTTVTPTIYGSAGGGGRATNSFGQGGISLFGGNGGRGGVNAGEATAGQQPGGGGGGTRSGSSGAGGAGRCNVTAF